MAQLFGAPPLTPRSVARGGEKHSIPVVEDKPLPRSLDASVEVDGDPPEFYKAVAEIIHILYAKNLRKGSAK
jgi:flagellar biosynthesis protein FlhB